MSDLVGTQSVGFLTHPVTQAILTNANLNFFVDGLSRRSMDDGSKNNRVLTRLKYMKIQIA